MRKFLACGVIGLAVFGGALVACSGGGTSGGSQQAFCDTLKKDQDSLNALSDQSDLNDQQSLSVVTAAFNDLANKAPSEIKSDMDTIAKGVKDSANLDKALSNTNDLSKLSSLEESFSSQHKGFDQSIQNVEKFAKDKCGIDLTSGASSSTSSKSSSSRSSSSRSSASSDLNLSDLNQLSDLSDFSSFDSVLSELSSLSDLNSFNS